LNYNLLSLIGYSEVLLISAFSFKNPGSDGSGICISMKYFTFLSKILLFISILLLISCGGGSSDEDSNTTGGSSSGDGSGGDTTGGDGDPSNDFELTLHSNKHVAQIVLPDDIDVDDGTSLGNSLRIITKKLYERFNDNFDFILLVSNNDTQPAGISYSGIFHSPGDSGSAGKLQGIIHFPRISLVRNGPSLHEIGHNWAGHSGFIGYSGGTASSGSGTKATGVHADFDGEGTLGSFSGEHLVDEGGGLYSAPGFGTFANGGNGASYSGDVLFKMGFISKAAAGNVWVVENAESATGADPDRRYFTADSVTEMSYAAYNPDDPDTPLGDQSFKILTVLIDNVKPSEENLNSLDENTQWLTQTGDDGSFLFNFNEATNFKGTLISGQLDQDMK
jgi:hypothetical protein